MPATALTYATGLRPGVRPGVRPDGSYLPTVWGRTAKAMDLQPDDVREAVQLFADWTGITPDATDIRRVAHLIGCGFPPHAAAAREYGYRLWFQLAMPGCRGFHLIGM
jgi:hypothetical protein